MLRLRPVRIEDARMMLDWVNSADSLAGKALTTAPIAWVDHCVWLERRLADADSQMRIVEWDGEPVGQVRLQYDPALGHVVDIYVIPTRRGRGVALEALREAVAELRRSRPDAVVVAVVKLDNAASARLFQAADFRRTADHGDLACFLLPPEDSHA